MSKEKTKPHNRKLLEKYSELDTPFYLHSGISKDAFDYIELYIMITSPSLTT